MSRTACAVIFVAALVLTPQTWAQSDEDKVSFNITVKEHPKMKGGAFVVIECVRGCAWSKMTMDCGGLPCDAAFTDREAPVIDESQIQGIKRSSVTWAEAKDAMAATICIREEPRYPSGYLPSYGTREACGLDAPSGDLDEAVESAFAAAGPVMVGIKDVYSPMPGLDEAYSAESPAEQQRIAAAAFLSHEPFLRPVVPRLVEELDRRGIACEDCPSYEPSPPRRMTWVEFSPYVSAFILPHADAMAFHLCSGTDASQHVADKDPGLLRAGFLAAMQSDAARTRTFEVLQQFRTDSEFVELEDDDARMAFLHDVVVERFRTDQELHGQACAALRPYVTDLGLLLTDCGTNVARTE